MRADLFKSDGTVAQNYVLSANESRSSVRVAKSLSVTEPINAYLRIKNGKKPAAYTVTVFSNESRDFTPYSFGNGRIEAFSIDDDGGKSGRLKKSGDTESNIVYKTTLAAGEYRIFLRLKKRRRQKREHHGVASFD